LEILDEVNIKFKNLDADIRRKLHKKLRVFNPHAYHTPTYALGRWDGYTYYFSIGGNSYFYLLDKILPVLDEHGYKIEIEDHRKKYDFQFDEINEDYIEKLDLRWPDNHEYAGEKIKLRDYQIKAINDFLSSYQGVKEIPTGAGKTIVSALLAKLIEKYGNTITIVPSKSLILQTERDFKLLGLDVGVLYGDRKTIDCKHLIATWQTLESLNKASKKIKENILKALGDNLIAVIVDECHTAKGNILKSILTGPFSSIPLRFGISATVPKNLHETMPILCSLGNFIDKIEIKELQEKGVLSECMVKIYQFKDNYVSVNYKSEVEYLLCNEDRLKRIADLIKEIRKTGNTLVLIDRVKSGEILKNMIENCDFLSGTIKTEERKKHYDEFSNVDNKLLIATYGIASTGLNIPRIFNLVMIEPGKSFIKIIQSIGRGIRKAKDKEFVFIYDICSNSKYSKRHLEERKKYYKENKFNFELKIIPK
ncbi:MAG: DEAD/DEAH box helicase family protein, partial [candidate division WOR-3 bacterium]